MNQLLIDELFSDSLSGNVRKSQFFWMEPVFSSAGAHLHAANSLLKPSCFSACEETEVVLFPMLTINDPYPEFLTDLVKVTTDGTTEASAALQPGDSYSSSSSSG